MTKKILVSLNTPAVERANWLAHKEGRTRSDLVREALRRYEQDWKSRNPNEEVGRLAAAKWPGEE